MEQVSEKAKLIRKLCLEITTEAGSGHPTSCLSAADLTTVLFEKYFIYDVKNPKNPNNDRLIFSKGHAAPLLYTLFALSRAFSLEELRNLRKKGSMLEGHPRPVFPFADVATGSLGQGLSVGAGMALSAKKTKKDFKTFVLLGDGETAEGSIWEALSFASFYKLDNLIAVFDVNRLGQSGETSLGHDISEYISRISSFGWEVFVIDGHNLAEIDRAFKLGVENKSGKPFAIIAKTLKGKGVSFLENKEGKHGKSLSNGELKKAIKEIGNVDESLRFELQKPKSEHVFSEKVQTEVEVSYKKAEEISTREAFGNALVSLGKNKNIFVFDGDVKDSTFTEEFLKKFPKRFIECFIAEQNMVGVALGFSQLGLIPVVATFGAFFTRSFDQIRMATLSQANIKFVGSHAGVSIGQDGPSQMALEDISMFGALPGSTILQTSDGVSTSKILAKIVSEKGISYLRTQRIKTPVIYSLDEDFEIGGSKVLRESEKDFLTVVASGVTVFEALDAYEELKKRNIFVRVLDCYSVKPIDKRALLKSLEKTKERIIISVEDHYEHGGLGDFVLEAVSKEEARVEKIAVRKITGSATPEEQRELAGISSEHIVDKVLHFINE